MFSDSIFLQSSLKVLKRKQTQSLTPEQVSELGLLTLLIFGLTPQMVLSGLGLQKDQIPEKIERTFISSNQNKEIWYKHVLHYKMWGKPLKIISFYHAFLWQRLMTEPQYHSSSFSIIVKPPILAGHITIWNKAGHGFARCKFWPVKHKYILFAPSCNTKCLAGVRAILDHVDKGHLRNRRATSSQGP